MTDEDWKRWRAHNRQALSLGFALGTIYMKDGEIIEYREIYDERFLNDPSAKNEIVKWAPRSKHS